MLHPIGLHINNQTPNIRSPVCPAEHMPLRAYYCDYWPLSHTELMHGMLRQCPPGHMQGINHMCASVRPLLAPVATPVAPVATLKPLSTALPGALLQDREVELRGLWAVTFQPSPQNILTNRAFAPVATPFSQGVVTDSDATQCCKGQ